ncbi:DUF4199 domain-containing protein [Salmonirosea aquatica]|uniref:DUF4199 family protein n=1 Tax=Salmonirosea aquatica TaxID=2654236 RepID=A0A7C9F2C8_9BACT|nr:DUF4199 family protein [Cytophagaceae bacterium SJW1-29]
MRTEFKYAAILSVLLFVWLCLEFWIGFHDRYVSYLPLTTFLTSLVWSVGLFLEIREKEHTHPALTWNYGKRFRTAFLTTVLALPMLLLSRWIFYDLINPDFFNNVLTQSREWTAAGSGFESSVEMMEDYFEMKAYQTSSLIFNLLTGLVFSLLLPLFFRKKRY